MSQVIVRAHQVGISNTAANNFTLQTPAVPNGTMKLARGLPDATTQDIFTVGTDGKVAFNRGIVGLEGSPSSGWQKLPSGLIIQWGFSSAAGDATLTFPIVFPTGCMAVTATLYDSTVSTSIVKLQAASIGANAFILAKRYTGNGGASWGAASESVTWIAVGY